MDPSLAKDYAAISSRATTALMLPEPAGTPAPAGDRPTVQRFSMHSPSLDFVDEIEGRQRVEILKSRWRIRIVAHRVAHRERKTCVHLHLQGKVVLQKRVL